jgi:hypothetical protein
MLDRSRFLVVIFDKKIQQPSGMSSAPFSRQELEGINRKSFGADGNTIVSWHTQGLGDPVSTNFWHCSLRQTWFVVFSRRFPSLLLLAEMLEPQKRWMLTVCHCGSSHSHLCTLFQFSASAARVAVCVHPRGRHFDQPVLPPAERQTGTKAPLCLNRPPGTWRLFRRTPTISEHS